MDGRCETCKWWGRFPGNTGFCEMTMVDVAFPVHPESKATADISLSSGERSAARIWLTTASDFFCSQYTKRKDP